MAGLALVVVYYSLDPLLVTPRTAVQGGHGLAVKTMFRFNSSSPNKDECCGWGWLPRIREGSQVGKPRLGHETRPRG